MTQIETIILFGTIEIAARRAAKAVERNDTDELSVCFSELAEAMEKIVKALAKAGELAS